MWKVYLESGFNHILDMNGYDHILFLVALCAIYKWDQWRRIILLATAFTLGHSLTLALASLNLITISTKVVEFLIPVTILMTAIFNLTKWSKTLDFKAHYSLAAIFGLIHGMGFSGFYRSLVMEDESFVQGLLAFNIGVEFGQVIIVGIIMLINFFWNTTFNNKQELWNKLLSISAGIVAVILMIERI